MNFENQRAEIATLIEEAGKEIGIYIIESDNAWTNNGVLRKLREFTKRGGTVKVLYVGDNFEYYRSKFSDFAIIEHERPGWMVMLPVPFCYNDKDRIVW